MAYVYVFQRGGENLFKTGLTRGDVEKRRKDLSTGNPHPLTTFRVIETVHDSLPENFLEFEQTVMVNKPKSRIGPAAGI